MRRLSLALLLAAGCNALAGTGKYQVDDCPDGVCVDGSRPPDGAGADAATSPDADAGADIGTDAPALPTCSGTQAPLSVTVVAAAGPGDTIVDTQTQGQIPPGTTQAYCTQTNAQYRLETRNGTSVAWSGVACKDGQQGSRCEFPLTTTGARVTVTE